MTALYETFLTRVDEEHAEETNNMLAVVLAVVVSCNAPSISIDHFRYILGFCSEDRYESQASVEGQDDFMKTNAILRSRIQERFGHLLVVQNIDDDDSSGDEADGETRDRNGTAQLYHLTVKDFLSQRKTAGQSLILSGQDLQHRGFEILTKACLRFLQCREVTKLMQDLESQGVKYFKKVEDADAVFRRLPLLIFTLKHFLFISCYAIQRNTANSDKLKAYWTNRNFEAWKSTTNTLLERNAVEPDSTLTALCIETDCDVFVRHQIEHQGVEPNELVPEFGSYLCLAAFVGSTKVVKMLLSLDRRVDIDFCSSFGTALTVAAARGQKDTVKVLLDNGANPDISGGLYEDPLAAAATSLNVDIVRLLWEHPSSSLSLKHSKFRTSRALLAIGSAIRYAFIVEDVEPSNNERRDASEVIQILAQNGLVMSIFSHISVPIFLWSLCVGSTEVMDLMLKDPTFILFKSASGQSLLHIVSSAGTLGMVKLIIKKFEDLEQSIDVRDERQCTLLHYATLNSDLAVVQYLLGLTDLDLDPNAKDLYGLTPLHAAFAIGRPKVVRLLLDAGSSIDEDGPEGLSMLHLAASNFCNPEVLDFLTDQLVDVTDDWDRTPLHIASQYGSDKTVQWLLDRSLDPSTPDARGRTALHCACQNQAPSSTDIIDMLLKKGASPTATDSAGSTPLHLAFHDPEYASSCLFWTAYVKDYWDKFLEVECARKAVHMLALDHEEEFINIQDDAGNTPLHLACWRGLGTVIVILIDLRARLDLRDERGCLAYQLIENSKVREAAEWVTTHLRY
jgi:ankyrin repeat protein